MKQTPRPAETDTVLSLRLPVRLLRQIDRLAFADGRHRAAFLRRQLEELVRIGGLPMLRAK